MAIYNNSWIMRKRITVIAIVLCILCITYFFSLPQVRADDGDDTSISGTEIFELLDNIFGTSTTSDDMGHGNGGTTITHSSTLIQLVCGDSSSQKSVTSLISTTSGIIKDIAYFFLVLIIAVKAIQEASRGDPTLETWLRMFMVAIAGIIFIEYSDEIFDYLSNLGDYFLAEMRNSVTSTFNSEFNDETATGISGIKAWKKKVVRLLIWAAKFAIVIPAWNMFYELAIRRIFAPIAVVDIAAEGMHSNGVRYMKNYFGIFVRVSLFYVIAYLMAVFLTVALSDSVDGWFISLLSTIGIIFGGVGLVGKSDSLVKEILGA